jgi:hypothetical protein
VRIDNSVTDAVMESDAAYPDVATLRGVGGVTNEIKVTNP